MSVSVELGDRHPDTSRQSLLEVPHQFSLDYTLPPQRSLYASTLVLLANIKLTQALPRYNQSALLAANAINLLILFKDKDKFSGTPTGACPPSLLILAYLSVITNTCVTVTSACATDMIIDMPRNSSCQACRMKKYIPEAGTTNQGVAEILEAFGAPKGFRKFYLRYWMVLFLTGFIVTVAEVLLFIGTVEIRRVGITLFIAIIVVCIPPCWYFVSRRGDSH
ncbi:hypothetical protein AB1N83_012009 [Pleurotus pulmonarius]